jgi:hypothetical protein
VVQRAVRFLQHVEARLNEPQALARSFGRRGTGGCRIECCRKGAPHPMPNTHPFRLGCRFHHLPCGRIDTADHPAIITDDTLSLFAESVYYDTIVY